MRTNGTRLTERFVAGLAFRGKEFVAWDDIVPGFGVRVWKGGKAYVLQYKFGGKSRRKTLGTPGQVKLEEVKVRAQKLKGMVSAGRDPAEDDKQAREAWTLRDAMDYFLGDYALRKKTDADYRRNSVNLAENATPRAWWARKLTTFTQDEITRRHQGMERTPYNANRYMALLSRLFSLGIEQGQCTVNPTKGIERFPETVRDRFLTDREVAAVWKYLQANPNVEPAVCVSLILLTGCRPGESYKAEWEQFDRENGVWSKPARNTKQRKDHRIQLTAATLHALGRLDTYKRSKFLFPSPDDPSKHRRNVREFWDALRKDLALPDNALLYTLRHTFASQILLHGANLIEVKNLLGHSRLSTTERYLHVSEERQRAAAELLTLLLPDYQDMDQIPRVLERRGKEIVESTEIVVGRALIDP